MAITAADIDFEQNARFSGQLRQNFPVTDPGGGQTDNYSTVLTTRVILQKDNGHFGFPEGRMEYIKSYTLICRYQKAISVGSDTQWLIRGETYSIADFDNISMEPFFITMRVTKNQPG
jgi:hypothetical protein